MGKQLTIHVRIQIAPENIDAFIKALRPAWQSCVNEPECVCFEVYRDVDTPGLFRFVETWSKDKEWFVNVSEVGSG